MSTASITSVGLPLSRALDAALAGPRWSIGRTHYADAARAAQADRIQASAGAVAHRASERAAVIRPADRVEISTARPGLERARVDAAATTYRPRANEPARSGALDVYA